MFACFNWKYFLLNPSTLYDYKLIILALQNTLWLFGHSHSCVLSSLCAGYEGVNFNKTYFSWKESSLWECNGYPGKPLIVLSLCPFQILIKIDSALSLGPRRLFWKWVTVKAVTPSKVLHTSQRKEWKELRDWVMRSSVGRNPD